MTLETIRRVRRHADGQVTVMLANGDKRILAPGQFNEAAYRRTNSTTGTCQAEAVNP